MALPSADAFATPLGPVPVDADARTVAAGLSAVVIDDEPHASEHAIETQLPFLLRTLGPGVPLVPIVVGDTPPAAVSTLLSTLLRDRKSTRLNSSHANISYAVFCL